MNSGRSHLTSTVPAILLLFVSVFRLGDGACGCPDHNAWVELVVGVEEEIVDACSHTSEPSSRSDDQWEHSCDGVPLGHYVDNSRTPHVDESHPAYQLAATCPHDTASQMPKSMCDAAPPPHDAVVLTRPALKVYQV